jgi:hypothetical protein
MQPTRSDNMKVRTLARHAVVLLGGFIAGGRFVEAAQAWREWHRWTVADPSAADLYRTTFWIAVTIAGLSLGLGALVFWMLRPSAEATPTGAAV